MCRRNLFDDRDGLTVCVLGWALYRKGKTECVEERHEILATLMLGTAITHVTGVSWSRRIHRKNLVKAMWTRRKKGNPAQAILDSKKCVGWSLLVIWVSCGMWLFWYCDTGPLGADNTYFSFVRASIHYSFL